MMLNRIIRSIHLHVKTFATSDKIRFMEMNSIDINKRCVEMFLTFRQNYHSVQSHVENCFLLFFRISEKVLKPAQKLIFFEELISFSARFECIYEHGLGILRTCLFYDCFPLRAYARHCYHYTESESI